MKTFKFDVRFKNGGRGLYLDEISVQAEDYKEAYSSAVQEAVDMLVIEAVQDDRDAEDFEIVSHQKERD